MHAIPGECEQVGGVVALDARQVGLVVADLYLVLHRALEALADAALVDTEHYRRADLYDQDYEEQRRVLKHTTKITNIEEYTNTQPQED